MDEHQWLECVSPTAMLFHLRPWRRHRRKFRLYVCAWWRLSWHLLNEPCRNLIDLTERYPAGLAGADELRRARRAVARQARRELAETGTDGLAELGPGLLQMLRLEHLPGWEGGSEPRESWFTGTEEARRAYEAEKWAYVQHKLNLLRDIFGNPFRPPPPFPPSVRTWNNGAVVKMATVIYDERAWDRLPILADALADAGCDDAALLGHLRGPEPHVLGCWAVDLLLGRS